MNETQFERLARALTGPRSRRAASALLGGLIAAPFLAPDDTAVKGKKRRKNKRKKRKHRCKGGLTRCGKDCLTLQNDNANCGACGKACAGSAQCQGQVCVPSYVERSFTPFTEPFDLFVDASGAKFVTFTLQECVRQYSSTYTLEYTYGICGNQGSDNTRLGRPRDAVAYGNRVFISDYENNRVQIFARNGAYVGQLASGPGSGNTQVTGPGGLALDANQNIYVADTDGHRVLMFNSSYAHVRTIGTGVPGPGNNQLISPTDLAVDGAGNLYVSDFGNTRVQKFSGADGSYLATFAGFPDIENVAVTRAGDMFVRAGDGDFQVEQLTIEGKRVHAFPVTPTSEPLGVYVDTSDVLYILEENGIRTYTPAT
ncbi:MAG: hypothetical protein QM692_19860 [Thermomicrobiales bacterium]